MMCNSPTRTPGQVAYEGFWCTTSPDFRDDWPMLPPSTQARWEAAAQAVLAQCPPQENAP
jgi:hypothetical protein